MAHYFECPVEYEGPGPSLFLAGGITGCPDWQAEIRERLDDTSLALLNPRRSNTKFFFDDPNAASAQIEWEFRHLRRASGILFWFTAEQVQPIALYELGAWSMTSKPLIIGAHPNYSRRCDVVMQMRLARPEIVVVDSLEALSRAVHATRFN
jgi:hypothetical protein